MKFNFSLKQSWSVVVLIAVIVPVFIVMTWYGTTMYRHQINSALTIERQANELLKNTIESEVKRFSTLFKTKTDPLSLLVNKTDDPEVRKDINTLLGRIVEREPVIQKLIILSPQAEVIAAVDPAVGLMAEMILSAQEKRFAALHWGFSQGKVKPEIVVALTGKSYTGSLRQHEDFIAFSMAEPIGTPANAVLVALVNFTKLWRQTNSNLHDMIDHSMGMSSQLDYMLDHRGTLITEVNVGSYKPGDLMTHLEIARTALLNKDWPAKSSYIGINNQPVYGTLTAIPSLNWALISEVKVSEITDPIWAFLVKFGLITLLGMIFFIGFILYLVNRTLRPIQRICEAMNKVARGEYQFELEPPGISELDGMTNSFIHMAKTRQRTENLLCEREQDLAITLNSIGDAVIATDAEGRVTRMNPVAETLTGWTFEQASGETLQTIFTIIDASTRESIPNPIEKVIAMGKTIQVNNIILSSKGGSEYYIANSTSPIRDNDGKIHGVVLVFNDVTEQYRLRDITKSAQHALQHKEKEQHEILDSMLDAVISADGSGNIMSFNKAAEVLFGYSRDEIINQNVGHLMPGSDSKRHDVYMQNYLQSGITQIVGINREVKAQHKDKHIFPIRISVAELPTYEFSERRFIATCQDLTQIKQQEEQMRRAQKMDALGKLTGGIAHDFNNILNVVIGYASLLKDMSAELPKVSKYADQIHHAGMRGASLTKKLLYFSRQEAHQASKIDINTLLRGQQEMLQKILTVRVKLQLNLAIDVWPIWLDGNDLEDAILNLSINAMHAMRDQQSTAELTISTSCQTLNSFDADMFGLRSGDYVLLSVKDTGVGMDQTIKEKIFDPFFSTKGEQGTGLGLSQVFGFVKRAGGTIKVFSKSRVGSEFVLYFPRSSDKDTAAETSEDVNDLCGTENILIVDDESALRNLTSEQLRNQGYKIFCGENGKQALQVLEHEDIDLMISDVIMPEIDGYQLASIVREKYPDIKIQLASGFTDDLHMNISDQSLHKNLIYKPYKLETLLKSIRALLDNKPDCSLEKHKSAVD